MNNAGIYCIENSINGKKYIGQSINVFYRWNQHKYELNSGTHFNDYLQKSWDKYGSQNFNFYVIEFCDTNNLDEREMYYIDFYDTLNRDNGYNLTSGGTLGKKASVETCNKISQALKGHEVSIETRAKVSKNHADVSGKNNPMYGKHHTDDAKQKTGAANRGKISTRRNLNNVICIELNKQFDDATIAGKELSLDSSGILKCCRNERKTCGGYHWKFENLENNIS